MRKSHAGTGCFVVQNILVIPVHPPQENQVALNREEGVGGSWESGEWRGMSESAGQAGHGPGRSPEVLCKRSLVIHLRYMR
jgi:hypothetical protein